MEKMIIGIAPTRRNVFDAREAKRYKDMILAYMAKFEHVTFVDLEDINEEGLLVSDGDLEKVAEKFAAAKVNGLFIPHCNFGTEYLVSGLAKRLNVPVLLWGPRDDMPGEGGVRSRDTQCGLFATGKILRRFGVPFSYIPNCKITDPEFTNGFLTFVSVCSIVKAFRNLKVLQISTRPAPFWTMMVNEGELLEKFGVQVYPISMADLLLGMERIEKESGPAFQETVERFRRIDCSSLDGDKDIFKLAAMKVFIQQTAIEHGCAAACIQCWDALQDAIGLMPCAVNGMLADDGLPTMCETDIHGCISSVLLKAAVQSVTPVFFADLTIRHPENDNAELLWHCGNFPHTCALNPDAISVSRNFIIKSKAPGICNFELRREKVTVCRFDGDNGEYKLFIGECDATTGPMTSGTYIWVEVPDWKAWEYKLVTGPYVHHVAGAYGSVALALYEACKFIPGLEPDPMNPTREELEYQLAHRI